MTTYLALDGPFNGTYLDELTARSNRYVLTEWPTGETVWAFEESSHLLPSRQTLTDAVLESELR